MSEIVYFECRDLLGGRPSMDSELVYLSSLPSYKTRAQSPAYLKVVLLDILLGCCQSVSYAFKAMNF